MDLKRSLRGIIDVEAGISDGERDVILITNEITFKINPLKKRFIQLSFDSFNP